MAAKKKRTTPKAQIPLGFLTGGEPMPEEFRPNGKRVLIEKPEFQLVEYWRQEFPQVIWAPEILNSYLRSKGHPHEARKSNTSLSYVLPMMKALLFLPGYISDDSGIKGSAGSSQISDLFSKALGPCLERILSAKDDEKAKEACIDAVTVCQSALNGFSAWHQKHTDGRRTSTAPAIHDIIDIAEFLIVGNRRLPSKQEIQAFAESVGFAFPKNRNEKGKWREAFGSAGIFGFP
jgi:hypothetical protein